MIEYQTIKRGGVSVIVPCYNASKFIANLSSCIEGQIKSLKDIEFIFVNDGSKDDTLYGLCNLKQIYPDNVIVVDKPNGGVSSARNVGIEKASFEWVAFLDSDDLYAEGGLNFLLKHHCSEPIDILQFESKTLSSVPTTFAEFTNNTIYEGDSKEYYANLSAITVWKFLFKREYLVKNNIRFRDLRIGEDGLFLFDSCIANGTIKYVDTIVTYHIDRPGSLTSSIDPKYVRVIVQSVMYAQKVFYSYKKANPNDTLINAKITNHQQRQIRFVFRKILQTPNFRINEIRECCKQFFAFEAFPIHNKQKGDIIINFLYQHSLIYKVFSFAYILFLRLRSII